MTARTGPDLRNAHEFALTRFCAFGRQFEQIANLDEDHQARAILKATKADAGFWLAKLLRERLITTGNPETDAVLLRTADRCMDSPDAAEREAVSAILFGEMQWLFAQSPNPLSIEIVKRFEGGSLGKSSKHWRVVASRCAGFCGDIQKKLAENSTEPAKTNSQPTAKPKGGRALPGQLELLIAALTNHHRYDQGDKPDLNQTPMSLAEMAAAIGRAKSAVSDTWLPKLFAKPGSYAKYEQCCENYVALLTKLQQWNHHEIGLLRTNLQEAIVRNVGDD